MGGKGRTKESNSVLQKRPEVVRYLQSLVEKNITNYIIAKEVEFLITEVILTETHWNLINSTSKNHNPCNKKQ